MEELLKAAGVAEGRAAEGDGGRRRVLVVQNKTDLLKTAAAEEADVERSVESPTTTKPGVVLLRQTRKKPPSSPGRTIESTWRRPSEELGRSEELGCGDDDEGGYVSFDVAAKELRLMMSESREGDGVPCRRRGRILDGTLCGFLRLCTQKASTT